MPNGPVVSVGGISLITWTFSGGDPAFWMVMQGDSAVGPWTEFDEVAGANRSYGGLDTPHWYAVQGVDDSDVPITALSNPVFVSE